MKRGPLRQTRSKRSWQAARAKVDAQGACRVCGRTDSLQAAHIIARSRVPPGDGEHPDNIVPLCAQHHAAFDAGTLDLLPYLTPVEQAKAVELCNGIMDAYRRITGERLAA